MLIVKLFESCMAKKPPFARGYRVCIFCGATGLTKEHLWADWLKAYISKDEMDHEVQELFFPTSGPEHDRKIKKRSGDVRSRTLRIVCKPCNNGWMSALQQRAKPILIPLLTGAATTVSVSDQETLAAWSTMVIMVGEYMKPETAVISQNERDHLRLTQYPPPTWRVWIANLTGGAGAWASSRFTVCKSKDGTHPHKNGTPSPNVHETSFVVGKLLIRGVSSPFLELVNLRQFTVQDERFMIIPIWPKRDRELLWPPKLSMSRDQWVVAASRLFELVMKANR